MIVLSLFLLGVSWFGLFGQPEKEILDKVINAPAQVEFHGVWQKSFCYRGDWFETEQEIWHRRPNRTKILFLSPEKVQGTVLFKEGDRLVFQREGGSEGVRHTRHYAGGFFGEELNARRLDLLLDNYEISHGPRARLLGRKAEEVRIVPKYANRTRLVLWVDEQSGLILKLEKYDREGNQVSRAQFSSLVFELPNSAEFTIPPDSTSPRSDFRQVSVYADLHEFRGHNRFDYYVPNELPQGFELDRIRSIQKKNREIYHFLYTDGLSWISLFQHPSGDDADSRSAAAVDTVEQRGTMMVLHGEVGRISYALVGEVAADELRAMSASLQPAPPAEASGRSARRFLLIGLPVVIVLVLFLILRAKQETRNV